MCKLHNAPRYHMADAISLDRHKFQRAKRKPCNSHQTYFSFPSPSPLHNAHAHAEKYGCLRVGLRLGLRAIRNKDAITLSRMESFFRIDPACQNGSQLYCTLACQNGSASYCTLACQNGSASYCTLACQNGSPLYCTY